MILLFYSSQSFFRISHVMHVLFSVSVASQYRHSFASIYAPLNLPTSIDCLVARMMQAYDPARQFSFQLSTSTHVSWISYSSLTKKKLNISYSPVHKPSPPIHHTRAKNGVAGNRTQNLLQLSTAAEQQVLRRCHTTRPQPQLMKLGASGCVYDCGYTRGGRMGLKMAEDWPWETGRWGLELGLKRWRRYGG
jgi:hypothetical protein